MLFRQRGKLVVNSDDMTTDQKHCMIFNDVFYNNVVFSIILYNNHDNGVIVKNVCYSQCARRIKI